MWFWLNGTWTAYWLCWASFYWEKINLLMTMLLMMFRTDWVGSFQRWIWYARKSSCYAFMCFHDFFIYWMFMKTCFLEEMSSCELVPSCCGFLSKSCLLNFMRRIYDHVILMGWEFLLEFFLRVGCIWTLEEDVNHVMTRRRKFLLWTWGMLHYMHNELYK